MENKHCWHKTGYTYSNGVESKHEECCCHCGKRLMTMTRYVRPPGHGLYMPRASWPAETVVDGSYGDDCPGWPPL